MTMAPSSLGGHDDGFKWPQWQRLDSSSSSRVSLFGFGLYGGSGVPLYGTLIDLLVLMNPCLGVLLIGALQPYLDYVVADFHWSAAV
ncbi:hypothetical protein SO802_033181 [Lithocarpus litseifolius]|uniref:Uncharacterized protein n=1 Tax=Lithocarpus litseifolius TaxID=425828 RepID=A0AAW2BC82_9ROSI